MSGFMEKLRLAEKTAEHLFREGKPRINRIPSQAGREQFQSVF